MSDDALSAMGELVIGIDHIGIAVPDLDEALAFYSSAFGAVNEHEEVNEEQGVREAMLRVGGSDTRIQLLAPLHEETTIGRFIKDKGPGIQQMAYRVSDIDKAGEVLRAQGLRLLYDEPRIGTAGSRVNFVHPKSGRGVLIELVEPAAHGH
jgi:methylmalonyl-CoA/ethylmalonyl-CoA epimerase